MARLAREYRVIALALQQDTPKQRRRIRRIKAAKKLSEKLTATPLTLQTQ
jgi:hypothetical protein